MLTMFFLSCVPPLVLLGRLLGPLGSLLVWFPWRRRRLKFMSLMLLLNSLFLARWPRSVSSWPPPEDILLRRQRTPVDASKADQSDYARWKICILINLKLTLAVLFFPLSLFFSVSLFSLILVLPLNFEASLESILRPPHVHQQQRTFPWGNASPTLCLPFDSSIWQLDGLSNDITQQEVLWAVFLDNYKVMEESGRRVILFP